MNPEDNVGKLIRSNHPFAFRSGQWGRIVDIGSVHRYDNVCYFIEWDDDDDRLRKDDQWPVDDPMAGYEFREA